MTRRRQKLAVAALVAALFLGVASPARADTITGVPMRPVLAGNLVTYNAWAAWAGTTLSVEKPGGRIRWTMNTSIWVAVGGQAISYSGKVSASAWVERSTALCLFVCTPTTWNLVGPDNQCWYTDAPAYNVAAWGMGDRGCWPAPTNLSYYKLTVVVTWQVPLDTDTTGGQPTYHSVVLESPAVLVR